jgi:hypothetical protein
VIRKIKKHGKGHTEEFAATANKGEMAEHLDLNKEGKPSR